jgi:membrane protease YdiL (CAAX protease family)
MPDTDEKPPLAQPVVGPAVARPVVSVPAARPAAVRFPQIPLKRSGALADIVIVACFSLAFEGFLSLLDVPEKVAALWPQVGLLGVNALLGSFNLLLVALMLIVRRQPIAGLGLDRPFNSRTLAAAAIALPACYAASVTGAMVYAAVTGFDTEAMLAEKTDLADLVAHIPLRWILPLALFVGIHEEILFRGFYLSRVRALSRSGIVAILATSVVFGLMHMYQGLLGVFQTTAIGLALAIIVTYARSLWPAIIAHAVFDATNMLLLPWLLKTMQELEKAA